MSKPFYVGNNVIDVSMDGMLGYFIKSDNSLWVQGFDLFPQLSKKPKFYDKPVKILDDIKSIGKGGTLGYKMIIKKTIPFG